MVQSDSSLGLKVGSAFLETDGLWRWWEGKAILQKSVLWKDENARWAVNSVHHRHLGVEVLALMILHYTGTLPLKINY